MDGLEFESYCCGLFNSLDFVTERTKSSGDQGADLIYYDGLEKVVVQLKRYDGNVGNKAVQEVFSAKGYYKSCRGIVLTNSFFTKSAYELAININIELWDRVKLSELIIKSLRKNKCNSQ